MCSMESEKTKLKSIDTCKEDEVYMGHYKTNVEI